MDKRKKYTILTNYYRPKPGGFCKRYFRAINALLDRGHTVHYLAVVEYPIKHVNCHFHRFPWPRDFTDNMLFWAVLHLLSPVILLYIGARYDVTHAFAFHPTYGLFLQPARLFRKIPLVIFYRADHIISHGIKSRPGWLVQLELFVERIAVRNTAVYCVSDTLVKILKGRIKSLKGTTIDALPNNIDHIDVLHQIDGIFHLACIGLIEKIKNHDLMLRAIKELADEKIILDIYGTGPYLNHLVNLSCELGVNDIVRFHGWVVSENIWPHVDLLLMPSLREGAPNSVLESIGAGVAVLASDIPEHREILPKQQLVAGNSPTDWSKRIREILENRDKILHDMVTDQNNATRNLVFDWDDVITRRILRI